MLYIPPNQDKDLQDRALGPSLLTGVFSAFFALALTVAVAPHLLRFLPEATLSGIIGLALIYSFYVWLARDLQLPFLVHVSVFSLFQWLVLFPICLEQRRFPAGMLHPFALIHIQPWWFTITVLEGLIALAFNSTLLALQKLPKPLPPIPGEIYSDTFHLSLGPWEQNWKSWRFGIFGTTLVTAISYLIGYAYLDLKRSAVWAGLFLWFQLGLGIWLLLIGQFYYRRAVWSSTNQVPDPEAKRVWGRGLGAWFSLAAFISFVLPVNWRLSQWWLAQFLMSGFRFLMGDNFQMPSDQQNPYNSMNPPVKPPTDSNWVIALISLLYKGTIFLFGLICLMLVLILIGYLLQRFYAKEADRLKGLPKALIKLYLFWRDWWRQRRRSLGQRRPSLSVTEDPGPEEIKDAAGKTRRNNSFGQGPQAVIRRGYYRLIQSARLNGYLWRQEQTPKEIAEELNSMLPESEEALTGIADGYQQARYGPKPPAGNIARLFERLRRDVQNRLRFLK